MSIYKPEDFDLKAFAFFCKSLETDDEGNIVKLVIHRAFQYKVEFNKDNQPRIVQKNQNPWGDL